MQPQGVPTKTIFRSSSVPLTVQKNSEQSWDQHLFELPLRAAQPDLQPLFCYKARKPEQNPRNFHRRVPWVGFRIPTSNPEARPIEHLLRGSFLTALSQLFGVAPKHTPIGRNMTWC